MKFNILANRAFLQMVQIRHWKFWTAWFSFRKTETEPTSGFPCSREI